MEVEMRAKQAQSRQQTGLPYPTDGMVGELKHSIAVVADGPTCMGFRLAGVQKIFPLAGIEAEGKAEELLGAEEVGILIINEKTINAMDWRLKKKIERLAKPVVIAVPDKAGPMEQADSLRNMVKKALGFELMK